jgi:hypothetical protein
MMRLVPPNPFGRLFKGASSDVQHEFQVTVHTQSPEPLSNEELEDAAERALELLLERADDVALGPAVGCNFETNQVEMIFSVEASSVENLHKRLGQVLSLLEAADPFCYHDSTALRVDDDDREAVFA